MHTNPHRNFLKTMLLAPLGFMGAVFTSGLSSKAESSGAKDHRSIETRLRRLEDFEEIRRLLVDYGRTLDQRDFAGFSRLFTENAEYIGGGGMGVTKGAAAIGELLKEIFRKNPTGERSPNFHLFANETIEVKDNEAVAISKGFSVVPGEAGRPEMVMLATYNDTLIRQNGRWKFKQRKVHGDIPAPPASK
jgi:uncharacterized protein (TIGR02246 family)